MKIFKILASLVLSFVLVIGFSACGSAESGNNGADSQNVSSADKQVSYPLTLRDQSGRDVTIEKEPQKLVSGYYISSSLLIALGLSDKLVGIEAKANKRPIYKLAAPKLLDLPSVGTAKDLNVEACASLEPDLVILPLKQKDAASSLQNLGIPTLLVKPESDSLLTEMTDIVARATNTVSRGDELKDYVAAQKDQLSSKLQGVSQASVYMGSSSNLLSTAGGSMYQNDMIAQAGGKNVASDIKDTYWATVNNEQILSWNPDYIVLAAEAEYSVDDVKNNQALATCNSIVSGNVYKMPSDVEAWDSPLPGSFLGSVWLASVIHPDKISDDYFQNSMKEFYEKFYGFTYQGQ